MMNTLLQWVKHQLKVKSISQRELSRRAGVSHSLISNALRGERPVTIDFCKAVAKGLDEPIWNVLIMGGILDEIPKELTESEEIKLLILKFDRLNVSNKADLLKYLDWILLKQEKPEG
jgi:transcriptional regulator with XRE-family HTH domain